MTPLPSTTGPTPLSLLGQPEKAVEDYERALQRDPWDGVAHRNRGMALLSLGREREAQEAFTEALRLGYDEGELDAAVLDLESQP